MSAGMLVATCAAAEAVWLWTMPADPLRLRSEAFARPGGSESGVIFPERQRTSGSTDPADDGGAKAGTDMRHELVKKTGAEVAAEVGANTEADASARQAQLSLSIAMLRAAIAQGTSLPHALSAVGGVTGGQLGGQLAMVGTSLERGTRWRDAWAPHVRERDTPDAPDAMTAKACALIEDTLEPSWSHGSSPVDRLELAGEQLDRRRRSAIEQAAGQLSVKLLLPTALCFLPAFIFIGVVPAIASFMF